MKGRLSNFGRLTEMVVWLSATFTPQRAKLKVRLRGEDIVRHSEGKNLEDAAKKILQSIGG